MICTQSCVVSRAFLFCALKKLSFLFHLDAAVFLFRSQSTEYTRKPSSSTHPKGLWRSGLSTVKPPWLGVASHPPGGAGWSRTPGLWSKKRHGPAPWPSPITSPLWAAIFSSSSPICLAPFNCNLFQTGTLCIKGLEQCAPDGIVRVLSRQPQGFTIQERNFLKHFSAFDTCKCGWELPKPWYFSPSHRSRRQGLGLESQLFSSFFLIKKTPKTRPPPIPFSHPYDCREKLVNVTGVDLAGSKPDGK